MNNKLYSYVLVALQFIIILLLMMRGTSVFFQIIPLCIFISGLALGLYALFYNQPTNINIIPDIKDNAVLITTGAYRYIRHPMYFAVIVMMLGVVLSNFNFMSLFLYILLIVVLFLKAKKEEILWMEKSEEYRRYMKRSKRIIPFIL